MKIKNLLERALQHWPVKIISLSLAIVLFFFTRLLEIKENSVNLPIRYELPSGFAISEDYPNFARVTLRGTEDILQRVQETEVLIVADFADRIAEGQQTVSLRYRKIGVTANLEPLEIMVEPGQVTIKIERVEERIVPVVADLRNQVRNGYNLASYSLAPSQVRISGPKSLIPGVSSISTEPLDLSTKNTSFNQRLRLQNPNSFIRPVGVDSVEISVIITEASGLSTFNQVRIEFEGLDPAYRPITDAGLGSLKLQGAQSIIGTLKAEEVRLIADASIVTGPGTYTLSVRAVVPESYELVEYGPQTLDLEFAPSTAPIPPETP